MICAPLLIALSFPMAYFASGLSGFLLSAFLLGAGFACSNSPSTQMVLRLAPEGLQAISASMDITFARLGGVMTVALLVQFEFSQSMWVVMCISVYAMICAGVIRPKSVELGHN